MNIYLKCIHLHSKRKKKQTRTNDGNAAADDDDENNDLDNDDDDDDDVCQFVLTPIPNIFSFGIVGYRPVILYMIFF